MTSGKSPTGSFTDTPCPWVLPGDRFRGWAGCWHREVVSRHHPCHSLRPSEELESIRLDGFNEFTHGIYLICLISLQCKQLLSDRHKEIAVMGKDRVIMFGFCCCSINAMPNPVS